jgi:hypothetical protein
MISLFMAVLSRNVEYYKFFKELQQKSFGAWCREIVGWTAKLPTFSVSVNFPPHPFPLPSGEGGFIFLLLFRETRFFSSPLWGEDQGEGIKIQSVTNEPSATNERRSYSRRLKPAANIIKTENEDISILLV